MYHQFWTAVIVALQSPTINVNEVGVAAAFPADVR